MPKIPYQQAHSLSRIALTRRHRADEGFRSVGTASLLVVIVVVLFGAGFMLVARSSPPVMQPIEFPHFRHAGSVLEGGHEINCLYCHTYARRSPVAGIPPLAKCMGCHRYIATDKEPIKRLTEYWKNGRPMPWRKVHDLPDFVYFSHERHIQRFVFQEGQPVQQVCGYCHGDVKTMKVAERRRPLTMGWCLRCHEQFQDTGSQTPAPAQDWLIEPADVGLAGPAAHRGVPRNAPSDCWECHK